MGINRLLKRSQKRLREMGVRDHLPGRTFVKSQGCYNCLHFDRGPTFENLKVSTGMRDVRALADQGKTQGQIISIMAGREARLQEAGAGVCLGGGGKGYFVSAKYMCDKWTGRVAVDRLDGGIDPLPEDLKDMLGDYSTPAPPSVDEAASRVLEAIAAAARLGEGVAVNEDVRQAVGEGFQDVLTEIEAEAPDEAAEGTLAEIEAEDTPHDATCSGCPGCPDCEPEIPDDALAEENSAPDDGDDE